MASTQQISIPDETRIYAIGDIHGRADLLTHMLQRITADAEKILLKRKVLIFLGDYIDRGPHASQVIDMLISKDLKGFESIHLKGNHEDMLLSFLDEGKYGTMWLLNGGEETLESYGLGINATRQEFRHALPSCHLDFLKGLTLSHTEGDYFFTHAGVKPGTPLEKQNEIDLLWVRGEFLKCREPFGKIVVHGHTVNEAPCVRANRIGIDTGAYYTNCLTCLVLEGEERRFLQT